jgi:hypothetical protein
MNLSNQSGPMNPAPGVPSAGDSAYLQLGELLAVSLALLVMLATTHLEDADLVVLAMGQDRGRDRRAGDQGAANPDVCAVPDSKHLVDDNLLAHIRSNLFYFDFFAGSNTVLFAAGFYDRVHMNLFN